MATTAEVEVLCQQLKGRGMYAVPPTLPTTSDFKSGNSVHFQPIDPTQEPSVQTMDQSLLNSSLNLLDDSPQSQSSSSNRQIPCGQTTPQGSVHKGSYPVLPTPYINQTAVDQHMGAQPAPILPRMSTGPMNLQSPKQVLSPRMPSSVQPQQLPFVDAPLAPTKNYPVDNTNSPPTHETRSKSSNRPWASTSPFTWPGSRAGSARLEVNFPRAASQAAGPSNCDSPISPISDTVSPWDMNTSTSWDVIDPYCDEEVTSITKGQSQPQVNRPADANTDSDPSNLDLGLEQVSDTNPNHNLGTLYNQDFFVADTTGRRLSQILYKSNYPYPLPNGHSALQLRLPDLLIYLKTDTYLMDVNTGEHYAVYSDRIQKMSVTPKLYLAWGYRQLLHTIQGDLVSIHCSLPPVECDKEYRQYQDQLNHPL